MKNWWTKKNVLVFGLAGALLLLVVMFPVDFGVCEKSNYDCRTNLDFLQDIISVFPILLLFSLITYKMRDEVFEHWIKFAKWAVPTMIILTYLILGGAQSGGLGMASVYSSAFDTLLLIVLYVTFAGVSLWRIVQKYRELKRIS